MSTAPQPALRTLLQLLRGELSPQQGMAVRVQLAADLTSARRFATLLAVTQNAATSAGVSVHFDDISIDDVAAFVDGTLSASEEVQFEEQCWLQESLLREVVANWNSTGVVTADASTAITENRILQIALASVKAADAPGERNEFSLPESKPVSRAVGRPLKQRRKISGRATVVVATVAVLAIVAIIAVLQRERLSNPEDIVSDPPEDDLRDVNPDRESIVKDAVNPGSNILAPNGPDRVAPHDPLVAPDPDKTSENIADVPGANPGITSVDPPKPIMVPDPESPQRVPSALTAMVETWSDDGGIVVVRSPSTGVWSGVKSLAAETIRTTSDVATVMTLQNSRAELSLVGAGQIILDGESSIEIFAPDHVMADAVDSPDADLPTSEDSGGRVFLNYGRIVFNQLLAGKSLTVRIADVTYSLEATEENTTIGIDWTGEFPVFAVFRGEATINDHQLTRRVWVRADSVRGLTEFSDIPDDADWTRKRVTTNEVPRSLAVSVNKSDSAVVAVANLQADDNPMIAFHATQVLLQCSGTLELPVSAEAIRAAAFSPVESVRLSLVYWMLLKLKHDRGRDPQLSDSLLQPIGFEVDEQATLNAWFLAASTGQRPTRQHLTALQTALRNTGPIFGRQCAKHFLQTILSDPLTEYDPATPNNRTALNSVTRKMRAWQQKNLP